MMTSHSTKRFLVILAILFIIGTAALAASIVKFIDQTNKADESIRHHICLLDRLFGLDKPVPHRKLMRLRPIQRMALYELIDECPGLKGHHR